MPFSVHSRCECQATLTATLDEHRHVLEGAASLHGEKEIAPAESLRADLEKFNVAWACPFCGRNTLRSFDAGAFASA